MKYFLFLALPCYALDQVTKYLTLKFVPLGESHTVIPDFFYIVHVTNTGAAFGMLQNNNLFFIGLAVTAMIVLIVMKIKGAFPGRVASVAWALLLSGVAGNLTDRIAHGSVVDFLDFILPIYGHWPAFNIADSCICVAAVLLIGFSLLSSEKKTEKTA